MKRSVILKSFKSRSRSFSRKDAKIESEQNILAKRATRQISIQKIPKFRGSGSGFENSEISHGSGYGPYRMETPKKSQKLRNPGAPGSGLKNPKKIPKNAETIPKNAEKIPKNPEKIPKNPAKIHKN